MTDQNTPTADTKMFITVDLDVPIVRGETKIDMVQLRRPMGGALRGLSMMDLIKMDYAAIRTLVPRISDPVLSEQDFDRQLDAADILKLSSECAGFFIPKEINPFHDQ